MPLGTSYGYPVKTADELGLTDYFRKNPKVAGMAWGGGLNGTDPKEPRVIVANPFNRQVADPNKMQGLLKIEAARHLMDESGYVPEFNLSKEQQEWRKTLGDDYANDDISLKKSIVSRVLADDFVPGVLVQQKEDAAKINSVLEERENPDFIKSVTRGFVEGTSQVLDAVNFGNMLDRGIDIVAPKMMERNYPDGQQSPEVIPEKPAAVTLPKIEPEPPKFEMKQIEPFLQKIDTTANELAEANPEFDAGLYSRSMKQRINDIAASLAEAGLDRNFIEEDIQGEIDNMIKQAPKFVSQYKKPPEEKNATGRTPQQIYGMPGNVAFWDPWKTQ